MGSYKGSVCLIELAVNHQIYRSKSENEGEIQLFPATISGTNAYK